MKKTLITLFTLLIFNSSQAGWFDKKIEIKNCYDHKKFKNFKEAKRAGTTNDTFWELDIENDKAVLSYMSLNRRTLENHTIKAKTDDYIIVGDNKLPDVHFDLKNNTLSYRYPAKNINRFEKCDFD